MTGAIAGDTAVQSDVLEDLTSAVNYRHWIVDLTRPYLNGRALEIGSGTGDYAADWAARGVDITASEADPGRLAALRARFAGDPRVHVEELLAPITGTSDFDAVVAVNVLEHIDDHVGALRSFGRQVRPGGTVVLFVPAFPIGMSRFDREIGHFRRYRKASLRRALTDAGLAVEQIRHVNAVGLLAWILLVRLLHGRPQAGVMLRLWDGVFVPMLRRIEAHVEPPWGQSLLAVATRR